MTSIPLTRDLVLVGGGHTHALVLRLFGMTPVPGLSITVINPGPTAPYTGMLPGHIAGHYGRDALEIDLYRLARFASARLLTDIAFDFDLAKKVVLLASGRRVSYDVASLDIGVTSTLPGIHGSAAHGIPAKPLGPLAARWRKFLEDGGSDNVAVIGGGVAGVELAMAMAHRLGQDRPAANVTVIERADALMALPQKSQARLRAKLDKMKIKLLENSEVLRLSAEGVHLRGDEMIPSAFTVTASGARPHPWLGQTGLELHEGFVTVDSNLLTSDPSIFAAGDCAHLSHAPRPKAGVFAVRAAPVLAANLTAAVAGGARRRFDPQKDYLKLISLGAKDALGEKAGIALSGPWVWRLKDRIDRRFMDQLNALTPMATPKLPKRVANDVRDILSAKPHLCAGCGSKVGARTLNEALGKIGDDAAVASIGGVKQALTTDHLTGFTNDPLLLARVAALHAMGDIWAMGGTPTSALAQITLPRMTDALAGRWLSEIIDGAKAAFDPEDVEIVGGHTNQGAAIQIGFSVTGAISGAPIRQSGANAGDDLILTRPIGSGVLLAADMRLQAKGDDLAGLFRTLTTSQSGAAAILKSAHAMTDVTGFGLAGHLMNILRASDLGAELEIEKVPLFDGALALAEQGLRSTLWESNRAAVSIDLSGHPAADLMFDPQTAGGLLAAVDPGQTQTLLRALTDLGHVSAKIGRLSAGTPHIKLG